MLIIHTMGFKISIKQCDLPIHAVTTPQDIHSIPLINLMQVSSSPQCPLWATTTHLISACKLLATVGEHRNMQDIRGAHRCTHTVATPRPFWSRWDTCISYYIYLWVAMKIMEIVVITILLHQSLGKGMLMLHCLPLLYSWQDVNELLLTR